MRSGGTAAVSMLILACCRMHTVTVDPPHHIAAISMLILACCRMHTVAADLWCKVISFFIPFS